MRQGPSVLRVRKGWFVALATAVTVIAGTVGAIASPVSAAEASVAPASANVVLAHHHGGKKPVCVTASPTATIATVTRTATIVVKDLVATPDGVTANLTYSGVIPGALRDLTLRAEGDFDNGLGLPVSPTASSGSSAVPFDALFENGETVRVSLAIGDGSGGRVAAAATGSDALIVGAGGTVTFTVTVTGPDTVTVPGEVKCSTASPTKPCKKGKKSKKPHHAAETVLGAPKHLKEPKAA